MPDPTILDRLVLLKRVQGDTKILTEVVQVFFDTYPDELRDLERHVKEQDLVTSERLAHSLKGSLQTFFKGELPLQSYQVELAARNGNAEQTKAAFIELQKAFERAQPALESLREYLE